MGEKTRSKGTLGPKWSDLVQERTLFRQKLCPDRVNKKKNYDSHACFKLKYVSWKRKVCELSDMQYFATRVAKSAISVDWGILFARFGGYEPYPKFAAGEKKTKIHSMKKMEELGPTLLSHFFSARSKMSFETLFMARQERILQYHRMITLTKLFSYKFSWQKRKSCHVDMISNRHP